MPFHFSRISRIREKTQERLEDYTNEPARFYFMTTLAALLAGLGLIMNNTAVIIGAMVISPIIIPIIGFSLALLAFDMHRLLWALVNLVIASIVTVLIAFLVGMLEILISGNAPTMTNEMFIRTEPNIFYFIIAICSGIAGAYGYSRPNISESLTGVAIAVAIAPPLAVSGIGFAITNYHMAYQSLTLFLFNLAGIFFGSILLFITLGFAKDVEIKK